MFTSPCPDGIPNEIYYLLRMNESLRARLKACFTYSFKTCKLPSTMRRTYYRLICKQGKFTADDISTDMLYDTATGPSDLGN
jgi:hypothetical protein